MVTTYDAIVVNFRNIVIQIKKNYYIDIDEIQLNKNDNFTSEITIFIFTLAIFRAISLSTSYEDFQFET